MFSGFFDGFLSRLLLPIVIIVLFGILKSTGFVMEGMLVIIFIIIFLPLSVRTIPKGKVGGVLRGGRFLETREAGVTFLIPFYDKLTLVAQGEKEELPLFGLTVTTKDKKTVLTDTIVYFQVTDASRFFREPALLEIIAETFEKEMQETVGTLSLSEAHQREQEIGETLRRKLEQATSQFGMRILGAEPIILDEQQEDDWH